MVQAASYPPLQRTQERGTHCSGTGKENKEAWVTRQYSYNANNRITTSGYTFDAAGNIINDGCHTYTYDAENRIVKVDSGSTGVYTYDADGDRARAHRRERQRGGELQ